MKKIIALFLAIVMSLSVLAVPAFAEETTAADAAGVVETVDESSKNASNATKDVTAFDFFDLMVDAMYEVRRILHEFIGKTYAIFNQVCPVCDEVHKVGSYDYRHIVTFNYNYDGAPKAKSVRVEVGECVSEGEAPVRAGYVFKGWFTDKNCTKEFNFDKVVKKDITLYAKWEEIVIVNVTVTFDLNYDGAPENEVRTVNAGDRVYTDVPVREGYTFKGWFTESIGLNAFESGTAVNENIVLYAKWKTTVPLTEFAADVDSLSVGEEEDVLFTVVAADDVTAVEIFMDGEKLGDMNDNGEDGDIEANDGVFSFTYTFDPEDEEEYVLFAKSGDSKSEEITLCAYDNPTVDEFTNFAAVLTTLKEIADGFKGEDGKVPADKFEACMAAVKAKLDEYASDGTVVDFYVNSDGNGFVIEHSSGIPLAFSVEVGEDTLASGKTLNIMSQINSYLADSDKAAEATSLLTGSKVEMMRLGDSVTWSKDGEVTLDSLNDMGENQVILWSGHGIRTRSCTYLETQEPLDTLVEWAGDASHAADLSFIKNKMCVTTDGNIAVNHKYLRKKLPSLAGSFVYLLSCTSGDDANLCNAFIKNGAESLVAVHKSINAEYGYKMQATLASTLTKINYATNDYYTVGEAMAYCVSLYGMNDGNDAYPFVYPAGSLRESYKIADAGVGTLAGKVCDASDRITAIGGATIDIDRNGEDVRDLNTDTNGNYSVELAEGEYLVNISAPGYIPFNAYANVIPDENTYMETFLLVDGDPEDFGIAAGTVFNSRTGIGESGVTLTVKRDWNNISEDAETVATTTTDSEGKYSVELNLGNYTVILSKDGFNNSSFNIVVTEGTTYNQNGTITQTVDPILESDDYYITLTWGLNPRDLDSHVEGKLSDGTGFHVYYPSSKKIQRDNGEIICELDYDDTDGEGPEHITLKATSSEPYYYYIHLFAGTGTIATSGASIKVECGGTHVKTFHVPSNIGTDLYWNVFAIKDGQIITKNTMSSTPDTSYAD